MSFILDALRKAEHERKLGQPPDLSSPPPLPGPSGTPPSRRRLVGLIVLVLGLVVLALLVWPRDPSPEPMAEPVAQAAPPAAAPAPVPVPAPTLPPPQDEPVVEDGEELPAPLDGDADLASLDELVDDSAAATADADTGADPLVQDEAAVAQQTAESAAVEEPALAEPEPEPATDPSAASDLEHVKRLRDMPVAYRNSFPGIKLEVHVYDADPVRRWVLLGGKKYGEGVTTAEGAEIVAITPDGVVFSYRGERVLVPLNR